MRLLTFILGVSVSFPVFSNQAVAGSEIPTYGSIAAPPGFSSACARYDWLCQSKGSRSVNDDEALRVLQVVNRFVNSRVKPVVDPRRSFYWSVSDSGDCKDFALSKMKTLLHVGFPSSRLALSVVLDRGRKNHMVLLARLNSGDYVLDNLSGAVKPWRQTGYTFLASQNFTQKGSWQVTLAGPGARSFYED